MGQIRFRRVVLIAVFVVVAWSLWTQHSVAQPAMIGRSKKPIEGATPGPRMDAIRAGRFLMDPPTLENLGFRWYVTGDTNRNATVAVNYREKGDADWSEALPMLRVHYEIANQDYEPYRVGNLFAGSVLFLKPGTDYEVQLTMNDPDGGAPAEPKVVSVSTRSEPKAPEGREIQADPESGLMAAYERARPGDTIVLQPGTYKGPFRLDRSGEPGRPIVFRSSDAGDAILEGDGTDSRIRIVEIAGTDHLMFEGLTFQKAHTALSTQPFYGGPVYLIRNEAYGITALNFKLNNYPAGILAYNNTVCSARQAFTPPAIWQNGHFHNNLFMGGRGYAMETGSPTPYSTLDYNGYRRNEETRFLKWIDADRHVGRYGSIEEMHRATGLEEHGLEVDYDIFVKAGPAGEGETYSPSDYDLRLRPEAKCIDAGTTIPQVTDGFAGAAPDLGCYELGRERPRYGCR